MRTEIFLDLTMLELHLLRHAKTNQISPTGRDYDRELLPKGHQQCKLMAEFIQKNDGFKGVVLVSSAKRTMQTLENIEPVLSPFEVIKSKDWYLSHYQTILDSIWKHNHKQPLLFVGHNFGISDLMNYLTGNDEELRTCGYVKIQFPFDRWSEISRETGIIVDRFRPEI